MNYFGGLREVLLFYVKSKTKASDSSTFYYVVKEIISMVHPHMVEMFDPSKNHISSSGNGFEMFAVFNCW